MERVGNLYGGFYTVNDGGVVTDDFSSQSAGTQLTDDSNWELLFDGGGTPGRFDYVSGGRIENVTAPSAGGRRLVRYASSFTTDHYDQAVYYSDIGYTWVFVRGDASGNCYYAFYGEDFRAIYRLDAGIFTELAADSTATVDGATVRLEANGSTIRMLVDTGGGLTEIHSVTDSTHSTQTDVGIGGSAPLGGQLDDFEAGPL